MTITRRHGRSRVLSLLSASSSPARRDDCYESVQAIGARHDPPGLSADGGPRRRNRSARDDVNVKFAWPAAAELSFGRRRLDDAVDILSAVPPSPLSSRELRPVRSGGDHYGGLSSASWSSSPASASGGTHRSSSWTPCIARADLPSLEVVRAWRRCRASKKLFPPKTGLQYHIDPAIEVDPTDGRRSRDCGHVARH